MDEADEARLAYTLKEKGILPWCGTGPDDRNRHLVKWVYRGADNWYPDLRDYGTQGFMIQLLEGHIANIEFAGRTGRRPDKVVVMLGDGEEFPAGDLGVALAHALLAVREEEARKARPLTLEEAVKDLVTYVALHPGKVSCAAADKIEKCAEVLIAEKTDE